MIVFPISYIVGDVLTEVYGFHRARQVIWLGFFCNLIAVLAIWLGGIMPAAPFWSGQDAYDTILGCQRPCVKRVNPGGSRSPHTGQRATREEVPATRVITLSVTRTAVKVSNLGAGSTVRESDMGDLDDLPDHFASQIASPLHRKLERTVETGQTHLERYPDLKDEFEPHDDP